MVHHWRGGTTCGRLLEGQEKGFVFKNTYCWRNVTLFLFQSQKSQQEMGETLQFPSFRLDTVVPQRPARYCWWQLAAPSLLQATWPRVALATPGAEESSHPLCIADAKARLACYHFCQLSCWAGYGLPQSTNWEQNESIKLPRKARLQFSWLFSYPCLAVAGTMWPETCCSIGDHWMLGTCFGRAVTG